MTRKEMNAICAALPGAENSDPWGGGHDAWKVGGKMFACIGTHTPRIAVKTDSIETAEMIISARSANFVEKLFLDRGTKIEARTADLILLASGRIGDVGTEAGSTGSAVL